MKNKICLTLDMDWANDTILEFTIETILHYHAKATIFVTHSTPLLDKIRQYSQNFELGIHPDYTNKTIDNITINEELDKLLKIVPEAKCSRSHSVVQSGLIFRTLFLKGIFIDSSLMLPGYADCKPFRQFVNQNEYIWRIPFIWADDYELCKSNNRFNLEELLTIQGTKIIMFHPIHIFSNAYSLADYAHFKKNQIIQKDFFGTFSFFRELLEKENNEYIFLSSLISEDKDTICEC